MMIYQIIVYIFVIFVLATPQGLWSSASQTLQEVLQDNTEIMTDEAAPDTPPAPSFDATTLENTALVSEESPKSADGVSTDNPLVALAAHDNVQPIREETTPPPSEGKKTSDEEAPPVESTESLEAPPPETEISEPKNKENQEESSSETNPESTLTDSLVPKEEPSNAKKIATATIKDAMEGAYNLSFLMLAEYKIKGSQNDLIQAKSGWLPQTSARLGYSYQTNYNKNTNALPSLNALGNAPYTSSSTTNSYGPQASLNLEQNLYNGGATTANIKASHKNLESAVAGYHHSEQEILMEAIKAHITTFASEKLHRIKENYLNVLKKGVEIVSAQHEYGDKSRYDVASTQGRMNEIHSEVIAAQNQIETSKTTYIKTTGLDPQKDLIEATGPENLLPKSKEEALRLCLKLNPIIRQLDAEAEAAQSVADYDRSGLLPKIDAIGQLKKAMSNTTNGTQYSGESSGQSHSAEANLSLTIPLDFAGTAQAKVRSAKYAAAQKRLASLIKRRHVLEATSHKWNQLEAERKKMIPLKEHLEATRVAVDVVKEEFLEGTKNTLELLTAEHEYFKTQENLLITQQNIVLFEYELLASIGLLTAKNLGLQVEEFDSKSAYDNMGWYGTHIGTDERFDKQIEHNARMIPGAGA